MPRISVSTVEVVNKRVCQSGEHLSLPKLFELNTSLFSICLYFIATEDTGDYQYKSLVLPQVAGMSLVSHATSNCNGTSSADFANEHMKSYIANLGRPSETSLGKTYNKPCYTTNNNTLERGSNGLLVKQQDMRSLRNGFMVSKRQRGEILNVVRKYLVNGSRG